MEKKEFKVGDRVERDGKRGKVTYVFKGADGLIQVKLEDGSAVEWDAEECNHADMGAKDDIMDGKLRWDLLPMEEIEDIVRLYTRGAEKYTPNGWKEVENGFERYRAALMRHMMSYIKEERYDQETGINHLVAVAWNAIAMLWFDKHGKGTMEGKGFGFIEKEDKK